MAINAVTQLEEQEFAPSPRRQIRGKSKRRSVPIALLLQMHRSSPTRSLDWGWQLANGLVLQRRNLPRTLGDDALRMAVEYKRQSHRRRKAVEPPAAADFLAAAIHLEESGGATKARLRAWLLTGLSMLEVAQRCKLPVKLVESYEALFFNVTDRLPARDWIMGQAVGGLPDAAVMDGAWVWRWLGYLGGPAVLEVVVQAVPLGRLPADLLRPPTAHLAGDICDAWTQLFALVATDPESGSKSQRFQQIAQIMRERATLHRRSSVVEHQLAAILLANKEFETQMGGNIARTRPLGEANSDLRYRATAA